MIYVIVVRNLAKGTSRVYVYARGLHNLQRVSLTSGKTDIRAESQQWELDIRLISGARMLGRFAPARDNFLSYSLHVGACTLCEFATS